MRNDDPPPYNEKVVLYERLKELSERIEQRTGVEGIRLDSYIVSATPYSDLKKRWAGVWSHEATREDFADKHVLFEDDLDARIRLLVEEKTNA